MQVEFIHHVEGLASRRLPTTLPILAPLHSYCNRKLANVTRLCKIQSTVYLIMRYSITIRNLCSIKTKNQFSLDIQMFTHMSCRLFPDYSNTGWPNKLHRACRIQLFVYDEYVHTYYVCFILKFKCVSLYQCIAIVSVILCKGL